MSYYDDYDDYPCDSCGDNDWCDHWEAMFCCRLCQYNGHEHCDD